MTHSETIASHRDIRTARARAGKIVVLACAVLLYYLFLLSNGGFALFAPELLGHAFNSMLMHLLAGDFTIDRDAIGYEAFTRDGRVYSYFGIFPAVLRVLALPFTPVGNANLARLSCLLAVTAFVASQCWMILIVHRALPPVRRSSYLLAVMLVATMMSGPQIWILSAATIYHEAILWSAAMAAAFNVIVLRAVFSRCSLDRGDLMGLALLAGLAINTRPSIGVALTLGTILLVLWSAWRRSSSGGGASLSKRALRLARDPTILAPAFILGSLGGVAAIVNFERWGSPFTFADFNYQDLLQPPQTIYDMGALRHYGEFSVGRVWIGALYYSTGIPWLLKSTAAFGPFLHARIMAIEGPPLIPVFTNPITIILAGIGLYSLRRTTRPDAGAWRIPNDGAAILRLTLLGHAAAIILVWSAIFFTLRYRFDFAPFMTLAAALGYRWLSVTASELPAKARLKLRIASAGLCAVGIVFSHYVLIMYKVWSFAVPIDVRRALLPLVPFPALQGLLSS